MKSLRVLIKHRTAPPWTPILFHYIRYEDPFNPRLPYDQYAPTIPPSSVYVYALTTNLSETILTPTRNPMDPSINRLLTSIPSRVDQTSPIPKGLHFGLWQNVYPISSPLEISLPSESRCEGYQRHQADDPPLYGPSYLARRPKT